MELERGIIAFGQSESEILATSRSFSMLVEEENKHIELFARYAAHLRSERPELVAPFERHFHFERGEPFDSRDRYPDAASHHFAFWLATLLFEDYTIYLHERLAGAAESIRPTWLAVHAAHRKEEEQHVLTDEAHLEALAVDADTRRFWSRRLHGWLAEEHGRFFALAAADRLVRELFADLPLAPVRGLLQTGMHRALLEHRLFRRTRAASPHLSELAAEAEAVEAEPQDIAVPEIEFFDLDSPRRRPQLVRRQRRVSQRHDQIHGRCSTRFARSGPRPSGCPSLMSARTTASPPWEAIRCRPSRPTPPWRIGWGGRSLPRC